jgi:hypothetical protein
LGGKRILRRSGHEGGEAGVGRSKIFEETLTLDRFEKEIDGDIRSTTIAVALEKITPGARITEAAEQSSSEVILIGDPMAEIAGFGTRPCFKGGLKKAVEIG